MVNLHAHLPKLSVIEAPGKLKLATLDNIPFDFQTWKGYVIKCVENAPKNFESRVRR